jgi:uncharacterized membrane protein required for colicin V production
MNWLDGVIFLIVFWFAWRGLRAGLATSLTQVIGLIGGLFISFIFYRPLATYLNEHWRITDKISSWLLLDVFWRPSVTIEIGKSNKLLALGILELLSFLIVLMISAYAISTIAYLFLSPGKYLFWGPLGLIGGFVLGAARGLGIVFILTAVFLPEQTKAVSFYGLVQPEWLVVPLQQSRFISLFKPWITQFWRFFSYFNLFN